jgi:predicted phosphoadenosine phosphosulfate sulfurtransferase
VSENFRRRFIQSFRVWGRVGRGLSDEVIADLEQNGIAFKTNGITPHGGQTKSRVRIRKFPDHLDMLKCHCSEVASWKRFAITILKNDHTCKYLGLAPTKEQAVRQREISQKYKGI